MLFCDLDSAERDFALSSAIEGEAERQRLLLYHGTTIAHAAWATVDDPDAEIPRVRFPRLIRQGMRAVGQLLPNTVVMAALTLLCDVSINLLCESGDPKYITVAAAERIQERMRRHSDDEWGSYQSA